MTVPDQDPSPTQSVSPATAAPRPSAVPRPTLPAPPHRAAPDLAEAVTTAVALGWQLSALYAAADDVDETGRSHGSTPALPSMGRLEPRTRTDLCLSQVRARVARLQACYGDHDGAEWPLARLQRLQQRKATGTAVRAAVPALHERLLRAMTWADVRVGKAYSLGADLERYCRRAPAERRLGDRADTAASLRGQVRPEETERIHRALRDLATILPDHAAETVTMSLLAWDRAVNALPAEDGHPEVSWPDALYAQGTRWRSLLTGETTAGDLVPLDAIVGSAVGSLWASRRLAGNALRSFAPVLVLIALAVVLLVGGALGSSADFGGKFASILVTLSAGAAGAWKAVTPAVGQAFKDHREEIVGASWNWAIAYEITPRPVRSHLRALERWEALDDFLGTIRHQGKRRGNRNHRPVVTS